MVMVMSLQSLAVKTRRQRSLHPRDAGFLKFFFIQLKAVIILKMLLVNIRWMAYCLQWLYKVN